MKMVQTVTNIKHSTVQYDFCDNQSQGVVVVVRNRDEMIFT